MLADLAAVIAGGGVFGFLSAVLPLGPVTVLVVQRTLAGDPSGALRFGLGRVPPEMVYCVLATFGTVALLDRYPMVRIGIDVLAIVLLLSVGVWLVAGKAALVAAEAATGIVEPRRNRWGFTTGLVVGALNPQYLLSWSAIVALAVSVADLQPSTLDRVVFPIAAAAGVTLGYVLLVRFLRSRGAHPEEPWVRPVLRGLGGVLIALALWNAGQLLGG